MTKYALIIPSFENNIGYKMAAVNTFLQHTPKNMDIYFVYGGNQNLCNKTEINGVSFTDVYVKTPDSIFNVHKKLFSVFKKILKKDYTHVLKIDDDTFLYNIDTFLDHKISGDYVGEKIIVDDEEVTRNILLHKKNYKVRESYKGDLPNFYCSGECVIFSRKALECIVSYKGKEKYAKFGVEDVMIGNILLSSGFKINPNKFLNYEHPVKIEKFHNLYNVHYKKDLVLS
mgnify:FL=1|tara:strand:+ start:676 stop:1362 length:687 start_codon:yes stop_codon:yes gene_type:complete